MSAPVRCTSYICESYREAEAIAEFLEQKYRALVERGALLTAITDRVLSVGITDEARGSLAHVDELVRHAALRCRLGDREVAVTRETE